MNYKRKKPRTKIARFPRNGTWSRMVHKWWIKFWSTERGFSGRKVRPRFSKEN